MGPAALLVGAVLLVPHAPPGTIDFGAVQLGRAGGRTVRIQALAVSASGAGFSASRTRGGVLVVYEPYELKEEATGALLVRRRSGSVRIALRGHGVDTIPPSVAVGTPQAARAGRLLTIRFAATDNDLVTTCVVKVGGRVIGRLPWPASSLRWRVPARLRGSVRFTVIAVDRAGNTAAAVTRAVPVRRPSSRR